MEIPDYTTGSPVVFYCMKKNYENLLAHHIVHHSCKVGVNDVVYINVTGYSCKLVEELVQEIYKIGGIPYVHFFPNDLVKMLLTNVDEGQIIRTLNKWVELEKGITKTIDCYVEIMNDEMLSDLGLANLVLYKKYYYLPIQWQCRAKLTGARWLTVRNPSGIIFSHAKQNTNKSLEWVWKTYSYDYSLLAIKMRPLAMLMEKADSIRIVAEETDITFSIKGQKAVICDGNINIPDGEVFVSPIKRSINGKIRFNVPMWYLGEYFNYISLVVKDGEVTGFSTDNMPGLTKVLNSDEGARYFGEFAIGTNPMINQSIGNTVFDEKMLGSVHLALGYCVEASPNGNESCIHMDMILDMRQNGELYFNDELIMKNGKFVIKELEGLNGDGKND